jgi:copper(I)-binding protein
MKNHHRRPVRIALAAVLTLAAPMTVLACGSDDEESSDGTTTTEASADATAPKVSDVWARPGTTDGNSAIYMTIAGGDEETELVKAEVAGDVAEKVELHETTTEGSDSGSATTEDSAMEGMEDGSTTTMGDMSGSGGSDDMGGMMSMKPVDAIPVPAGETVDLKPGGYHVMLIGLTKDLKAGDTLDVTLTFEPGGTVDATAEVREP